MTRGKKTHPAAIRSAVRSAADAFFRLWPGRIRRWGRLALDPAARVREAELHRLRSLPRYQHSTTRLFGVPFEFLDANSFLYLYDELVVKGSYTFSSPTPSPRIIDGGANIGVGILAFKRQYPAARIIAFEPDPEIFAMLERNCERFRWSDVTLVRKALWNAETQLDFSPDGADAGRLADGLTQEKTIKVRTGRLGDCLVEKVDLLKLDIEGAETVVLENCAGKLGCVDRIFVEYHSFAHQPQTLSRLVSVLADAGFRLQIHSPMMCGQPFVSRPTMHGMDALLHIFAFRT